MSLNLNYEQIRAEVINIGHSLTLNEIYALVRHEERRRGVMILAPSIRKYALVSSSSRGGCGSSIGQGHGGQSTFVSDDRDHLKCEHRRNFRHTKDQYWDLHRHPHDLAPRSVSRSGLGGGRYGRNKPNAHTITSTSTELPMMVSTIVCSNSHDTRVLSSDKIFVLRCFISQLDHSSITPTSFAHLGTTTFALSASLTGP